MAQLTKTQRQSDMPWDFSEVPKLVTRLLAGSFGHRFEVRRNKREEQISITWELGPTKDMVDRFTLKLFPRIRFDSDWGSREWDSPLMIDGRLLEPYFYSVRRIDLFNADANDIPRLIAAGADIEERNNRHNTPFEVAVLNRSESAAIALLEAGSDCCSCLPEGDLSEAKWLMPALWAAIESRMLTAAVPDSDALTASRQRRL